ncbi:MAG: hypothetical protein NVV82_02645 [Sporocytophaga sp.]|nr:hypothetical protein [Sporocytophaga sp.]
MNFKRYNRKNNRSAIEVHKHLGSGLFESAYEECLFLN